MRFPASIDSTMLSAFDACPRKFFYEFVLKKAPIGRSIHLHAGGCFASALENVRRLYYTQGITVDQALEETWPLFFKQWGDFDPPEGNYKDYINIWGALEAYMHEYHPEHDYFQPLMLHSGEPAVEFKFAIPFPIKHPDTGDPILFAGRADLLARTWNDQIYIVDEKTTNSLGPSWHKQWDMRGQFYGYTYAGRQMGYNVNGALVRGIAIKQTEFDFQEKVIFYTHAQLDRWWNMAQRKVHRMVNFYERAKRATDLELKYETWDMSFGEACGSYGGCQYREVCLTDEPWRILQGYDERIWDPLDPDPSKNSQDRSKGMHEITIEEFMGGYYGNM